MEPTNFFYNTSKWAILLFILLYFGVNCALLYKILIKGEKRRQLKKMLLAFIPFMVLGIYTLAFHINGAEIPVYGNISIFSAKLFICSSFFVFVFFQAVGFVADKIKYCCIYQLAQCIILAVTDLIHYISGMEMLGYTIILSVVIVVPTIFVSFRIFQICLQRFDTMMQILRRDNFIEVCIVISTVLFSSYVILITLLAHTSILMGIISLLLIFSMQILLFYRECRVPVLKKNYKVVKSEGEDCDMLMDGQSADEYKIIQRLILHFESHKPYLDSELKLAHVSRQIYTNRTYLSRALNHRLSKNFNQFVNYYRVKEACRLYIDNPLIKINEMSGKSGFKNLSSFSTAFSFNLRYTPAEWCREVRRRLNNNEHVTVEDYFR